MDRLTPAQMSVVARLSGQVVKGFGRGSKELGIPTGLVTRPGHCARFIIVLLPQCSSAFLWSHDRAANLDEQVVSALPESMGTGIYYGYAPCEGCAFCATIMQVGADRLGRGFQVGDERWLESFLQEREEVSGTSVVSRACRGSPSLLIRSVGRLFILRLLARADCVQEVHIIHKFDADFYDHTLKVLVLGFLRPEQNFPSLGEWPVWW